MAQTHQSKTSYSGMKRAIPPHRHSISRQQISAAALKVSDKLIKAGFEAYLVGGCIRDLLIGKTPKDFDVATDATPTQIKELFSNSRIIGRRFSIVHVRDKRELTEVTTFRGNPVAGDDAPLGVKKSSRGIMLRDNQYGTITDDFSRRDFTVNALYFNPADGVLYDFTDGMADLKARRLRMIGDPEQRYVEDPVRMIRAARLTAKLGFSLEQKTQDVIPDLASMLWDIPSARLFGEVCKLFLTGHGRASLATLKKLGLFSVLFKESAACEEHAGWGLIPVALQQTDERSVQGKPTSPQILYAALLWPAYQHRIDHTAKGNKKAQKIALETVQAPSSQMILTKQTSQAVCNIWAIQAQLATLEPNRQTVLERSKSQLVQACHFLTMRGIAERDQALTTHARRWLVYCYSD